MITFPINMISIEGPDLSGKTTLISDIHSKTNYRWHLMDRSKMSRMIFAKMYNRDISQTTREFYEEVSNLNNRYVFLMPTFDALKERYRHRGDEIHTIDSLKESYDLFFKEFSRLPFLSNVYGIMNGASNRLSNMVIDYHDCIEKHLSLKEVCGQVQNFVKHFPNKECNQLTFTLHDDGEFKESDISSMSEESEKEYYCHIYNTLMNKIDDEQAGKNPYERKEGIDSRRYVFTEDTCISMIHILNRGGVLDIRFVCRSTDINNKFEHDLKFLYFIASECWSLLGEGCNFCRIHFTLNSAHILE